MSSPSQKRRKINKFMLTFLIVIMFSILGFVLVRFGKSNYSKIEIKYLESSNINYKVYLKENNFFEEEYLGMNETYIASIIDYLDIDFHYVLNLAEEMDGKYSYYIKGIISADQANGGNNNYWKKEYILTERNNVDFVKKEKIEIDSNVIINYEQYNELLNSFKEEYGLAIDGNLKVMLVVENKFTSEIIEREILKSSDFELNIPLTNLTIEVPIESKVNESDGFLVNDTIIDNNLVYLISKVTGYVLFVSSAIGIIILIYLGIKRESLYQRKLRKILKTYDGILVEVDSLPDLGEYNTIFVKNFEELIDAHSEIRKPINFIQKVSGVRFVIINDGLVWEYTLKRSLLSKEKK